METDAIVETVERTFNSYIKSYMTICSKRFFSKQYQDFSHTSPIDQLKNELNVTISVTVNSIDEVNMSEWLNQALSTLDNKERQLIHNKFFLMKTDQEIASLLGISRQSVSKSKSKILKKLKNRLE